ncbi:hypothetical protein [Rhizobium binxianense]
MSSDTIFRWQKGRNPINASSFRGEISPDFQAGHWIIYAKLVGWHMLDFLIPIFSSTRTR